MPPLCAVSAYVSLCVFSERNNILSISSKQGKTKRTTYCPLQKTFSDKCAVYCPVHLPFLPQTHTLRHRITFLQRLSFSIREPGINGTYPENACGMVLLFQSIIVYGKQLNERMYENNEQNLSNAEIVHNKSIQDRRRDKKQK